MNNNGINGAGAVTPASAAVVVSTAANLEPLPPSHDIALAISREPGVVLAEAQKAAAALRDVISRKERPVKFNGEQYLEFEDWQTVGRFYGITAKVVSTRFVEFGDIRGFEATAEAIHAQTGQVISSATSMCLNEERNWSNKPLFQLMSMAETRACAKVLRNVLSWVVVLAGYRATPAEEMQGVPGFQDGIEIGNNAPNSKGAAQYVAQQKITEMQKRAAKKPANPDPMPKPWKTHGEFLALCELLREQVGETTYADELELAGVSTARDFINRQDVKGALQFYARLTAIKTEQERMQ